MGEASEIQLQIVVAEEGKFEPTNESISTPQRTYKRWLLITIYTFFSLSGSSMAVLLGRLYYDKGGNSKWLATFVQVAGFPILIPLYYLSSYKSANSNITTNPPSALVLSGMYSGLGLLLAADCLLYSVGLLYLPLSTYSLICASQLAFNALFSFFLNSQKFTPFIINSLVLLTISSTLLIFQNGSSQVSKGKYVIGFVCTVAASAGYGLLLSLTQVCLEKILKKQTFKVVLDMAIRPSLVATLVILVGLFGSGEWKTLGKEMEGFKLGKWSFWYGLL